LLSVGFLDAEVACGGCQVDATLEAEDFFAISTQSGCDINFSSRSNSNIMLFNSSSAFDKSPYRAIVSSCKVTLDS